MSGAAKPKLKTETNTVAMERRVKAAARAALQSEGHRPTVDFEHGQWWVSCSDCGGQWSVVDQQGGGDVDGFGFEQVTEGDDESCRR